MFLFTLAQFGGGYGSGYSGGSSVSSAIGSFIGPALAAGVIALVFWIVRSQGSGIAVRGPALVVKEFKVNPESADGVLVSIVGRPSGLISFLLSLIRLTDDTHLKVTRQEVQFTTSSLSGQLRRIVPTARIASSHCGFSKNLLLLIIGVLLALMGVGAFLNGVSNHATGVGVVLFLLFGGLGAAALYFYAVSRPVVIAIESGGGLVLGIRFKSSVLEGVRIDFNHARQVIDIINAQMHTPQR